MPTSRASLQHRYALLRDPHGVAPVLTVRAARFAARQRGCDLDLARLAATPVWQIDARVDGERLAAATGLLAARETLARAIDGARLRMLAEHFGEDLLDLVLAQPPMAGAVSVEATDPASLCRAGQRLMAEAADPANVDARLLCARAGELLVMVGDAA